MTATTAYKQRHSLIQATRTTFWRELAALLYGIRELIGVASVAHRAPSLKRETSVRWVPSRLEVSIVGFQFAAHRSSRISMEDDSEADERLNGSQGTAKASPTARVMSGEQTFLTVTLCLLPYTIVL